MKQRKIFFMIALMTLIFAIAVTAAPTIQDTMLNYSTPYSDGVFYSWATCIEDNQNLTGVRIWYIDGVNISTTNNTVDNGTLSEIGGGTFGAYVTGSNITYEVWCLNNDTKEQSTHVNVSYVIVNYPVDFDGYEIIPATITTTDDINVSLNCSDIHDKADVLTGYVGVYRNSVFNETYNMTVVNSTMSFVHTVDSALTSDYDAWKFDMWCGDAKSNTSVTTVSVSIGGDRAQDEVRDASLILNSIMAVLILGAIILPAGLIFAILNGNLDMTTGIFTIVTIMGLAILIMMFYFIKSAIIDAI